MSKAFRAFCGSLLLAVVLCVLPLRLSIWSFALATSVLVTPDQRRRNTVDVIGTPYLRPTLPEPLDGSLTRRLQTWRACDTCIVSRVPRPAITQPYSIAFVSVVAAWLLFISRVLRGRAFGKDRSRVDSAVGTALLQAGARGPAGLEASAKVALDFVTAAVTAGIKEYAASGDFGALRRQSAECRQELVNQVVTELESGSADLVSVSEYLVDSALSRVARCVQGGSGIYEELWALDEGRASVGSVKARHDADARRFGDDKYSSRATKDILIDEQHHKSAPLRPLFANVQPHVFSRSTSLALLGMFELFARRGRDAGQYTNEERGAIEHFLETIDRTPVMRRCRAEASKLESAPLSDGAWRNALWRIWFELPRAGHGCGFEHVFVGEALVDSLGRGVVGGLHNWFKFYLEEQRGTAKYLGQRYPGRTVDKLAIEDTRFVSGRFTLELNGQHLVKDVGGFFVGVSPEWQFAVATTAFFETATPERALARQWSQEFVFRDAGFVRVVMLDQFIYRFSMLRGPDGGLVTFYASQLGSWDRQARAELDEPLSTLGLEQRLPKLLVLHGFAEDPNLLASASRVAAAGASTLRGALLHLRHELNYTFEAIVSKDDEEVLRIVRDHCFRPLCQDLVAAHGRGELTFELWQALMANLERRYELSGRRLYQPVRLALTGKLRGHDLTELVRLIELLDAGAPWSTNLVPLHIRMARLARWLDSEGAVAAAPSPPDLS